MSVDNLTIGEYSPKLDSKLIKLTGQQIGRWTVFSYTGRQRYSPTSRRRSGWLCRCSCGTWKIVNTDNLLKQLTLSCGCLQVELAITRNRTHGDAGSRHSGGRAAEYRIYFHAKDRCTNPRNLAYATYGGRGIEFRFDSYEEFLQEVGRRPTPQHSLDRIDTNGHYERGNLRWATAQEQARNTRNNVNITANGITQCINAWAENLDIARGSINMRRKLGWCDACAVSIPRGGTCDHKRIVSD